VSFAPSSKDPTPIARIGIERISRKTDLIPPEKMKRILIESTKVRILNESRLLACPSCLNYAKIVRVKNMPEDYECPKCRSPLGISADTPDRIEKIRKKQKRALSESDKRTVDNLKASSLLLKKNGKIVAYILAGRRMSIADAKSVLRNTHRVSDRLFELIMEQEKKALRRRFW
jgi:ATP-dependent Lhr-like helicase